MAEFIKQVTDFAMLPQLFTATLELIINKALRHTSQPVNLADLQQKTLAVSLAELPFSISLTVSQDKVLCHTYTDNSDCLITTSIASLRKLKAEQQLTQLIKDNKLDVIGDIKVAQQFAQLIEGIEIDWQSELASHIGDIPTHKLTTFSNKITEKLKNTSETIQADVAEYVVYEQRLVASSVEIRQFSQAVDQIAEQVSDVEQRINALMTKLS